MRLLLLLLLACVACDAPWAGPALPAGAHWVAFTDRPVGPVGRTAPAIYASTSLAGLRAQVPPCATGSTASACWVTEVDLPARLYLSLLLTPTCIEPTKEAVALAGHDLYFVLWVGSPQGTCRVSAALPSYRLLVLRGSDLPSTGTLNVHLLVQDERSHSSPCSSSSSWWARAPEHWSG